MTIFVAVCDTHASRATRPVRTGHRAPGRADAGSAGRRRTPAVRRRGCRRPAPGRPDRRPWWWRPRRPAAPARRRRRSASTVVTDVCPRSSTTVVLPCVTRESTRAKIFSWAPTRGVGANVYTAPSALPSTSLPSARRAIAVKSVPSGRRHPPVAVPAGEVDPEVAAAGRQVGRALAVAGHRGRRSGQRHRSRRRPTRQRW